MRIALWLHLLATVVWVGGMFFAHVALRPAAAALPPPVRLPLVSATLATFLMWVAAAVVTIITTGFMMIFARGGFGAVGGSVHVMTVLGLVMATIYGFIMAVPFPRVRAGVAAGNLQAAGEALTQVRRLVGVNLVLGLVTITVAVLGHDVIG
jgi:uncharacterized membrane protein